MSSDECAKVSSFEKTRSDYPSRYKTSVNLFFPLSLLLVSIENRLILLESRNMLLTERNEIKLTDLGWSKIMDKTHASTFAGTPLYMSPEVFKADVLETEYYPNTDIWY